MPALYTAWLEIGVGGAGRGGMLMGGGVTWRRPLLNTPFSSSMDQTETTPTHSGTYLDTQIPRSATKQYGPLVDFHEATLWIVTPQQVRWQEPTSRAKEEILKCAKSCLRSPHSTAQDPFLQQHCFHTHLHVFSKRSVHYTRWRHGGHVTSVCLYEGFQSIWNFISISICLKLGDNKIRYRGNGYGWTTQQWSHITMEMSGQRYVTISIR
jgi:hypothetical protein